MASSSPATQKICMWVKSEIRPSTATISNCSFCDLCAMRSGRLCSFQYSVPTQKTVAIRKMPVHHQQGIRPVSAGNEKRQMMRGRRMHLFAQISFSLQKPEASAVAVHLRRACSAEWLDLNQDGTRRPHPNLRGNDDSANVTAGAISHARSIDDLIPSAKEIQKQAALKEAEKAEEYAKRLAAAPRPKSAL